MTHSGGIHVVALANAVAAVAALANVVCAALAVIAPQALVAYFQTWFHAIRLEPIEPATAWFQPGEFVLGMFFLGGTAWVLTALTAWLYNTWTSHQEA
jgi:hypothetical protein